MDLVYVGSQDVSGPGYDTSKVDLYRGHKNRLLWTADSSTYHPAEITIEKGENKQLSATITLLNPKVGQKVDISLNLSEPLKVTDSIDSRIQTTQH